MNNNKGLYYAVIYSYHWHVCTRKLLCVDCNKKVNHLQGRRGGTDHYCHYFYLPEAYHYDDKCNPEDVFKAMLIYALLFSTLCSDDRIRLLLKEGIYS